MAETKTKPKAKAKPKPKKAQADGYSPRLKDRYDREVREALRERFGYGSVMRVPRVDKITLNMGVGEAKINARALDKAADELTLIAGQRAQITRAKKSIAGFKIREGMPIGAKVTLRGARMWEFLDRLVSIALPRIRDFRGLSDRQFDGRGNYTFGLTEQVMFHEINQDRIDRVRGIVNGTTLRHDATKLGLKPLCGVCAANVGVPGVGERHALRYEDRLVSLVLCPHDLVGDVQDRHSAV